MAWREFLPDEFSKKKEKKKKNSDESSCNIPVPILYVLDDL